MGVSWPSSNLEDPLWIKGRNAVWSCHGSSWTPAPSYLSPGSAVSLLSLDPSLRLVRFLCVKSCYFPWKKIYFFLLQILGVSWYCPIYLTSGVDQKQEQRGCNKQIWNIIYYHRWSEENILPGKLTISVCSNFCWELSLTTLTFDVAVEKRDKCSLSKNLKKKNALLLSARGEHFS